MEEQQRKAAECAGEPGSPRRPNRLLQALQLKSQELAKRHAEAAERRRDPEAFLCVCSLLRWHACSGKRTASCPRSPSVLVPSACNLLYSYPPALQWAFATCFQACTVHQASPWRTRVS